MDPVGAVVGSIAAGALLVSYFNRIDESFEDLQRISNQDRASNVLFTRFSQEQERFVLIVHRLVSEATPEAEVASTPSHSNPKIRLESSKAVRDLGGKFQNDVLFLDAHEQINELIKVSRSITRADHEDQGATSSKAAASNKEWEHLIRSMSKCNDALAAAGGLDISAFPVRSSGSDIRLNLKSQKPSTAHKVELQEMLNTSSESSASFKHSRRRPAKIPTEIEDVDEDTQMPPLQKSRAATPDPRCATAQIACSTHPYRSIESCPRECGWQAERDNELANAVEVVQRLGAQVSAITEARSNASAISRRTGLNLKPCHVFLISWYPYYRG